MHPMKTLQTRMNLVHPTDHADLQVLCAIHRHRSVSRAADQVGRTQSAVSHALARLRERLEDPLFVRVGRAMQPTPRCDRLVHGLEPHLHAIDRLVRGPVEFDPSSSRRVFHLASIDLFDRFVLPAFRRALVASAPEVGLVVSTHGGQSIERMDRGELDAAIHPVLVGASEDPLPSGGLRRRTLAHDGWSLFHRVGREPCDDLDALCAADHLLVAPGEGPGLVDHALQALGRRRRVAVRLPGFAGALDMLEGSELVMVAPASLALLAPPSITTGPVPLDLPEHQLTLVWPERLHDDPAHRWFRAQLAAAVQTRMRGRPVVADS